MSPWPGKVVPERHQVFAGAERNVKCQGLEEGLLRLNKANYLKNIFKKNNNI